MAIQAARSSGTSGADATSTSRLTVAPTPATNCAPVCALQSPIEADSYGPPWAGPWVRG